MTSQSLLQERPPTRSVATPGHPATEHKREGDGTATMPLGEAIERWRHLRGTTPELAPAPSDPPRELRKPAPTPPAASAIPRAGRIRRTPHHDETYQVIQAYIADFARELNDRAPLKSSTARAYNLYKRSGLDRDGFIAQLYAARAIVKERTAAVRSHGEPTPAGFPVKHLAGYYFAVLEGLLGLRADQDAPREPIPPGRERG